MTDAQSDPKMEIAHVLNMDVVGYSTLLITEQSRVMGELTRIVKSTVRFRRAEAEGKLIRVPTGDGMLLVFFEDSEAPIECAMEIASAMKDHPEIRLRMGIHSGPVNQVVDVNDRSNVAGAGIDIAQRVMDCGDAGHILLSKRVADDLAPHPRWNPYLHDLGECEVKHGRKISLVNFYSDDFGNASVPGKLRNRRRAITGSAVWRRAAPLAGMALVIVAIASVLIIPHLRRTDAVAGEKSIAVLPFVDLSAAKDQEYFCDGKRQR